MTKALYEERQADYHRAAELFYVTKHSEPFVEAAQAFALVHARRFRPLPMDQARTLALVKHLTSSHCSSVVPRNARQNAMLAKRAVERLWLLLASDSFLKRRGERFGNCKLYNFLVNHAYHHAGNGPAFINMLALLKEKDFFDALQRESAILAFDQDLLELDIDYFELVEFEIAMDDSEHVLHEAAVRADGLVPEGTVLPNGCGARCIILQLQARRKGEPTPFHPKPLA